MNKKAIAILGAIFILIVGTLGFLIYSKYANKDTETNKIPDPVVDSSKQTNTTTPEVIPDTIIPPINLQNIFKLSEEEVVSPVLFFDGTGITYFNKQGQLMQATLQDAGGGVTQLAQKKNLDLPSKLGITKVLWPPAGDDFIAEISNSGKKLFSLYDAKVGAYTDLPEQITNLDWLPDGKRIYYIWLENNKANLSLANSDASNWSQISEIWEKQSRVVVSPDGLSIAYFEPNATTTSNSIYLISSDGKVWQTLVKEGYNYGVAWSPDGQKIIFSKKDASGKYSLWYYNILAGEVKNLKMAGLPSKIVWERDAKNVYIAVPSSGISKEEDKTEDGFVKLNTETLEKKTFEVGSVKVDARDLFLSSNSDKLFFRNAQDGMLYYLDLTK